MIVFHPPPEFLLDLWQRLSFLDTRVDFTSHPFQELPKLGDLSFSCGLSMTGYIHINVPSFKLAKGFNPRSDVPRLRTDSDPWIVQVLETISKKQHSGR